MHQFYITIHLSIYFSINFHLSIYLYKLKFENLTLAPIEKDLINLDLLTKNERQYLFAYHLNIYNKHSQFLNKNEKIWLAGFIQHF